MTDLYLVRHGETDWNAQRRIQGSTDVPLNATGKGQAEATARLLEARPLDGVVSSPLSRARETARIIAARVGLPEPEVLAALSERDYGAAEGLDWDEVERRYPEGARVPGRESREAVAARVVPALLHLAEQNAGGALVVVSHGGAIRSVLNAVDPDLRFGRIANGSVHSFRFADDALQLVAFDDPLRLVAVDDPIDQRSAGRRSADITAQNALESRDGRSTHE